MYNSEQCPYLFSVLGFLVLLVLALFCFVESFGIVYVLFCDCLLMISHTLNEYDDGDDVKCRLYKGVIKHYLVLVI